MMSENVMVSPLFHQRSHSMPVGHAFVNNNDGSQTPSGNNNNRTFDFKRPSPLKNDLSNEGFPLPVPKSLASQLSTKNNNEESTIEPKFFCNPKTIHHLYDYNTRQSCPIMFNCKMDRGFFVSQSHWTCYRRNYFQVTASFIIPGHSDGTCYALQDNNKPIQQFFLRLKACTSNSSDKKEGEEMTLVDNNNMIRPVALTQMTPKRDKGPQREPPTTPIIPSDTIYGCEQVCITFERLQFRVATANNGKRRASQQYFRLIFELLAQLDDQSYQIISECYSSPLVVRGRSPGHYSSEPSVSMNSSVDTTTTSSRKKRKTTPSTPTKSNNSPQEEKDTTITLPPPQYVFASPPMILQQQQQNHTRTTSSSATYVIPTTTTSNINSNSAFSNFHNRSQSANDSEFFARHRPSIKYQPSHLTENNNEVFDTSSYEVGMARALRNWQQQVQQHQRNDSYESFDNSNRASTRPGTPIPYHHHELYQNNYQYVDNNNNNDKRHHLVHDGNDMYNNNNNNNNNTTTNN